MGGSSPLESLTCWGNLLAYSKHGVYVKTHLIKFDKSKNSNTEN